MATFEEQISRSIDEMFDGARLMTGDTTRGEALVVASVVDASRRYRREPPRERFDRWILTRMIRQYADHPDLFADPREVADGEESGGSTFTVPAAVGDDRPVAESDVGLLMARMLDAHDHEPDRLSDVIRAEMAHLPLTERIAMWLVSVVQFDYKSAAAALEMGIGDLRHVLLHARRELQVRVAVSLQREMMEGSRDEDPRWTNGAQA